MKGFALGLSMPRLSAQNPPSTTRWEYLCENITGGFGALGSVREYLSEHGAEGWELVTMDPYTCLKRPLR